MKVSHADHVYGMMCVPHPPFSYILRMTPDFVGYIAATLTTISFVPQVIKTWKTRSAEDVSLWMYSIFTAGIVMWLIYGIWASAWPVAAANAVTLVLASAILAMKIRWG